MSENHGKYFAEFRVRIRNLGIPLNALNLWLSFYSGKEHGTTNIQLKPKKGTDGILEGQFAKGMIAEFFFKSYELSPWGSAWLDSLRDARIQNAKLILKSDEYIACEIQLHSRFDFARRWWNKPMYWVRNKLLEKMMRNQSQRQYYKIVPTFKIISETIERFAESCRKNASQA